MTIDFDTTDYEFSHGRLPRGRGGWAFAIERNGEPIWAPSGLLYREAKAWMLAYVRAKFLRGFVHTIYVCT